MSNSIPAREYMLDVFSSQEPIQFEQESWQSIFNIPRFFKIHAQNRPGYYFRYRVKDTNEIVACAHFTERTPGCFVSPYRGTYGGFEAANCDLALLESFIAKVERYLAAAGVKSMEVAQKPFAHDLSAGASSFNVLLRAGYRIGTYDLNYSLNVDQDELTVRMQRNNQKRVRKCAREGYTFFNCQTPEDCEAAYAAVAANRRAKGYTISMTFEQVMEMHDLFPGKVHFFTLKQGAIVIAGSVCLAVNTEVLYVFYWGDIPGYEAFSPVVALANGIHDFARQKGFTILDAGRSTDDSQPNYGLITFKEKLGFSASLKLTFTKELDHA